MHRRSFPQKKKCTEEVAEAFDSALLCVQGQTAMASVISVAAFFCQDSHQKHLDPIRSMAMECSFWLSKVWAGQLM
jgi:hypothetical protein